VSQSHDPAGERELPPATSRGSIPRSAGLCAHCLHARAVETRRGSTFVLCEASRTDPSLARYPQLPVIRCHGFESRERRDPQESHEVHEPVEPHEPDSPGAS